MRLGAATFLVVVLALSGCGGSARPAARSTAATTTRASEPASRGLPVTDPVAPDFALRDQDGRVVRLSAQRGRLVLLTFLYTQCRDVCPLIAAKLGAVVRAVPPAERRRLRVLAVSVDPAHDTRAAVRRFVRRLSLPAQFRYLTGNLDELRPIWQAYNLTVDVKNVETVDHSAYVLLIDRSGTPRLYYKPTFSAGAVLADLRRMARRSS